MVFKLPVMSCLAVTQHGRFFFQLAWFQENDTCFGFRSHPTVDEPDLDIVSLILSLILPLFFLGPLLSVEQGVLSPYPPSPMLCHTIWRQVESHLKKGIVTFWYNTKRFNTFVALPLCLLPQDLLKSVVDFYSYMCECFACMYVSVPSACPVPVRTITRHHILWNRSSRGFWATMWVLGTKPRLSTRARSTLNWARQLT